jgi:hypothetical protein
MNRSFKAQTNSHQSACRGAIANSFSFNPATRLVSPTNCTLSPCSSSPGSPRAGLHGTPECVLPKVLFYGAIHKSDADRRLGLCERMTREVPEFGCFEGVFGPALDLLIEHASIIVLDRFYDISALESHRIDPLLLRGKVLVSTPSFGIPPPLLSSLLAHNRCQMWSWITSTDRPSPL